MSIAQVEKDGEYLTARPDIRVRQSVGTKKSNSRDLNREISKNGAGILEVELFQTYKP